MSQISSKIFIDGGNPGETKQAKELLGYLDGQTTNPTLIARNLMKKTNLINNETMEQSNNGKSLTEEEALEEYRKIVQEMAKVIPQGSVSIQVFANDQTKAEDMLGQARLRNTWIKNASIKFPCTYEGLKAASEACSEMPVNITLVFSQSQAAAVYEATLDAQYPVFISPFVGRLDDIGENGMQVVGNIKKMYEGSDNHVEVLTASVRNMDHLLYALQLKSNIITIPFKVFQLWAEQKFSQPGPDFKYNKPDLKPIPYREDIKLGLNWPDYDLHHDLTDKGVSAFWSDWTGLFS